MMIFWPSLYFTPMESAGSEEASTWRQQQPASNAERTATRLYEDDRSVLSMLNFGCNYTKYAIISRLLLPIIKRWLPIMKNNSGIILSSPLNTIGSASTRMSLDMTSLI